MPINYIEKGSYLHEEVANAGHWLVDNGTYWESSNDDAVQAIIDNYDPLPKVIKHAVIEIKLASSAARDRYTTAGKGEIYRQKVYQAKRYITEFDAAGSELTDLTGYNFLVTERQAKMLPSISAAAYWIIGKRDEWMLLIEQIEQIERIAVESTKRASAPTDAQSIAATAVAQLDAV